MVLTNIYGLFMLMAVLFMRRLYSIDYTCTRSSGYGSLIWYQWHISG